jgi:ribonuclease III
MAVALTRRLGFVFADEQLLIEALTHRSHGSPHNERLEFLGDSVLNCAIAAELYRRFPKLSEGELSRLRAALVNKNTLHEIARELDLGEAVLLGEGELKSGGHTRPSILADALEAVFGAVYNDAGFDAAAGVVRNLFAAHLDALDPKALAKDPKTLLQEYLQGRKIALPKYTVLEIKGEAHDQTFRVECQIPALNVRGEGLGSSRKNAEQSAAAAAFERIANA